MENQTNPLSSQDRTKLLDLFSRKRSSALSLLAIIAGCAIVAYYLRARGLSNVEATVLAILCGGTFGLLVDVTQSRKRIADALRLLKSNDR